MSATDTLDEPKEPISGQLPKSLKQEIMRIAKLERRSFSAQVEIFLADAVTRQTTATEHPKAA